MAATVKVVTKARKAAGKCGKCGAALPAGSGYKWWKFRYGGKYVRCLKPECAPKGSELINSPYLSGCAAAEESFSEAVALATSVEDIKGACESAAEEVRSMGEQARESFDNMPEGLQQGDTGQTLEGRADACETLADDLDGVASDLEDDECIELDRDDEDDCALAAEAEGLEREDGETDDAWLERCREAVDGCNEARLTAAKEKAEEVSWEYDV